ncbi:MAG: spore cortex biosynthesis protein YabQ [Acutalibacteraceae bacterium]
METVYIISWEVFLYSLLSGVILFFIYDTIRFFRLNIAKSKKATFFLDLLFMIISAFFTYFLSLAYNFGVVRFYMIAGEAISFILLLLTIGRYTRLVYCNIFNFLYKKLTKIHNFFKKIMKYLLKNILKMVYNLTVKVKTFKNKFNKDLSNEKTRKSGS